MSSSRELANLYKQLALLCAAKVAVGPANVPTGGYSDTDMRAIMGGLDDNLYPVFFRYLQASGQYVDSMTGADVLKTRYLLSVMRNSDLIEEYSRITAAFKTFDVEVIGLKGIALASLVYSDPALRPMGDIDLLVKPHMTGRAAQALSSLGYMPIDDAKHKRWLADNHFHYSYFAPSNFGGRLVEIHWDILPGTDQVGLSVEDMWRRSTIYDVSCRPIRVFCAEDMIVHLVMHFSFHSIMALDKEQLVLSREGFRNLMRGLLDIAQVVSSERWVIRWDLLSDIANQARISKYIYVVLKLVNQLIDADIPETFFAMLEVKSTFRLDRIISNIIKLINQPNNDFVNQLRIRLIQLLWADSLNAKGMVVKDVVRNRIIDSDPKASRSLSN